jgi:NitT/TauT family transport system substrate-binding protein
MKRILLGLALAAGLAAAPPARAGDTITFAYLLDPVYETVLWPIRHGKVTSDKVTVDAKALAIPALLQATASKAYDVVMTAVVGVPKAAARGLDLKIIGIGLRSNRAGGGAAIWVKASSPIKTPQDLKGKTIGVYSLPSAGITLIRIALWKSFGFNVGLSGGDMHWVELPAPALPGALLSGKIDAATLIHSQAYAAGKSGDFRVLLETSPLADAAVGGQSISAVFVAFPERLKEKPDDYAAFVKLLRASVDYTLAHKDEVFEAVAKETHADPEFFRSWFASYSEVPVTIGQKDIAVIQKEWELCKELGVLQSYPKAADAVWNRAVQK